MLPASNHSDTNIDSIDLEKAFRHPARLYTARPLVSALDRLRKKGIQTHTIDSSNSAVIEELGEILALNNPRRRQMSDYWNQQRITSMYGDNNNVMAQRQRILSYQQSTQQDDARMTSNFCSPSGFAANAPFRNYQHHLQPSCQSSGYPNYSDPSRDPYSLSRTPYTTSFQPQVPQRQLARQQLYSTSYKVELNPLSRGLTYSQNEPSQYRGIQFHSQLQFHRTLAPANPKPQYALKYEQKQSVLTDFAEASFHLGKPGMFSNSKSDNFFARSFCDAQQPHPAASTFRLISAKSTPTDQPSSHTVSEVTIDTETKAKMPSKKRKSNGEGNAVTKRQKTVKIDKQAKLKQAKKSKDKGEEPAKYKLSKDIWMRILEHAPPSFLPKARLICKDFRAMVDQYESLFVNCLKENYGHRMPDPPLGFTQQQFNNLIQGKGCQNMGCKDKNVTRTHWPWKKRWCLSCWKTKISREDRVIKSRQMNYSRATITKMLECIPVGVHDSFMKPHDYVEEVSAIPPRSTKFYKYYLTEEVDQIVADYEALTPALYKENPDHSPEEKASAFAAYQELLNSLEDRRTEFFNRRKAKNDKELEWVKQVEAAIRWRRGKNRNPHDQARQGRKDLFTRRAAEDLPHIDSAFVQSTKPFKDACRVFRDPGTERGWQTLKPKIEKAYEDYQAQQRESNNTVLVDQSSHESTPVVADNEPQVRNDFTPYEHPRSHIQLLHSRSGISSMNSSPAPFHTPPYMGNGFSHMSSGSTQHSSFSSPAHRSMYADDDNYESDPNGLFIPQPRTHSHHSHHSATCLSSSADTNNMTSNDASRTQITIGSLLGPSSSGLPNYNIYQ